MKRFLTVLSLAGSIAIPGLAYSADGAATSCADYMAMDSSDRIKTIGDIISAMPDGAMPTEQMIDPTPSMSEMGSGGTTGGAMAPDIMVSMADDACGSHPDGTVGDAMEMMTGS